MTAEKRRVKRIGYIVEWRNHVKPDGKWINFPDVRVRTQKSLAIGEFTRRCRFIDIPKAIHKNRTMYQWLKYRGLARCVSVYKEVQDAT